MATANPLPPATLDDDLDVVPLDEAYLARLPAEVRAAIEGAEERIANGTARIVWQDAVPAALAEMRRPQAG